MLTLYTTFSKKDYNSYGKRWKDSVKKFWSKNTEIKIFCDAEYLEYYTPMPDQKNHQNFIKRVQDKYFNSTEKNLTIGQKTIKFSHKLFVIREGLKQQNNSGIFVWLDGDVETIDTVTENNFKKLLNRQYLACQTEKQFYKYPHIESGILIFDLEHPNTTRFANELELYCTTDKLFSIKKPYDGYIFGKILKDIDADFIDLNEKILMSGKASRKEDTFNHPFLAQRFIHHIGNQKN